jgi:hypothetical protein
MPETDWFASLFGFRETSWSATRAQFRVDGPELVSLPNGRRFRVGRFEVLSLGQLRASNATKGRLSVHHHVTDDALLLHAQAENAGATFQVASQFNCLEFPGPEVTPEEGVTGYALDRTQGPACSLAAAAGTVYRNYFAPVGDQVGQTSDFQLNTASVLQHRLEGLFDVRNGYTFAQPEQLARLADRIRDADRESLLETVCVGVHREVGVTFRNRWTEVEIPQTVTQVFCSAVSCAYAGLPVDLWEPLATLVLDAAYEATLRAASLDHAQGHGSGEVWLTFLGGGVFGNRPEWIAAAMRRAFERCADLDLQVRIAHFRRFDEQMRRALS